MTVEQQVAGLVLRMADRLTQRTDDLLEPHRLTSSQYEVLTALQTAGNDGLACGEIAGRLATRDPDITRLLDRLEDRGFINRVRGRPDRRVVRSRLTTEGRRVVVHLEAELRVMHADLLGGMSARDLGALRSLLATAG